LFCSERILCLARKRTIFLTIFLEAAVQGARSMQMPFGIRQQVEQIRAYAAMVAAEAQSSQAKELVALMHRSADDLELTARFVFAALGPDPTYLTRPVSDPLRPAASE
jgi:hypothetical protein